MILSTRASLSVCRTATPTAQQLRRPSKLAAPSPARSVRAAPRLTSRRLHSSRPTALFEVRHPCAAVLPPCIVSVLQWPEGRRALCSAATT